MADANSIYGAEIDAVIESVEDATDNISLKLYHLQKLAELTAFACEARRTLNGIFSNLEHYPEVSKYINKKVEAYNNWDEHPDTTGDVLQQMAMQIDALNTELSDSTQCVRNLRNKRREGTAAPAQ